MSKITATTGDGITIVKKNHELQENKASTQDTESLVINDDAKYDQKVVLSDSVLALQSLNSKSTDTEIFKATLKLTLEELSQEFVKRNEPYNQFDGRNGLARALVNVLKEEIFPRNDSMILNAEIFEDTQRIHTAFNISGNEIITICLGQSGSTIGNNYISTIMNEHKINKNGNYIGTSTDRHLLYKINTMFECKQQINTYRPRAIFVDLDKENIDNIQSTHLGSLIEQNNFISSSGSVDINNCFAQGYYTDGDAMIDEALRCIRSQLERCDSPQGFNMIHSIAGGTGAGFGSLLIHKLRDEFGDLLTASFCVYPSKDSLNVMQYYNAMFALNGVSDIMFVFDNNSLDTICRKRLKVSKPSFDDYNCLISMILSGITSSFRYECEPEINSNLQTLYETNAIFPGNVHLSASHSPYFVERCDEDVVITASSIYSQLFSSINNVSNIDICNGKILNYSCIYRCNTVNTLQQMDQYLRNKFMNSLWNQKTEFDPFPFKSSSIYNQSQYYNEYTPIIATSIIHSTAIKTVYQNIEQNVVKYFNQKQMLSLYYKQGMDENQFNEQKQNIRNLIQKYDAMEKGDSIVEDEVLVAMNKT